MAQWKTGPRPPGRDEGPGGLRTLTLTGESPQGLAQRPEPPVHPQASLMGPLPRPKPALSALAVPSQAGICSRMKINFSSTLQQQLCSLSQVRRLWLHKTHSALPRRGPEPQKQGSSPSWSLRVFGQCFLTAHCASQVAVPRAHPGVQGRAAAWHQV